MENSATYISARLLWGTYNSYRLWTLLLPSSTNFSPKALIARSTPLWIRLLYLALNILMNSLNFFWFRLMLKALLKRFKPSAPEGAEKRPVGDGVQKGKLGVEAVEGKGAKAKGE